MIWLSRTFRILLFTPAVWVAYKIIFNLLGADPAIELNHDLGQVALYMLIGNLLIGILIALVKRFPNPLRFLLRERRFMGVTSFVYICAHLFFYLASEAFAWKGFTQIVTKPYLILGFSAFLILLVLAATSNNFSVKKLGGLKWKKLHRWIYLAMVLITIHMLLIEKRDLVLFASVLLPYHLLQIYRFIKTRRKT